MPKQSERLIAYQERVENARTILDSLVKDSHVLPRVTKPLADARNNLGTVVRDLDGFIGEALRSER